MIERVYWGDKNPFSTSHPLKITFHNSSLKNLSQEDNEALHALLELSYLPQIEVLQTEPGDFPHFQLSPFDGEIQGFPLKIDYENGGYRLTSVYFPDHSQRRIKTSINQSGETADAENIFRDAIFARAHCQLGQHLFVTTSDYLLKHWTDDSLNNQVNPRTPSEAAQIVGLLLRSKGAFICRAGINYTASMNRGLFYWVLARFRLPKMWRYFGACIEAEKTRGDDISYLGGSVLKRCARAIEARDEIGKQFYLRQNNDTRDTMAYHFDYLTLLLAGTFDAEARIAHRAYQIVNLEKETHIFVA